MKHLGAPWARLKLFWLLNYSLFGLLFLSYGREHALAHDRVSVSFFIILSCAQAGIFSWIMLVALPAILYQCSWRKCSPLLFASCFATVSLFFIVLDAFTYSQFRTHLDVTLFSMMLGPARSQIFDLSWGDTLSIILAFSIIVALQIALYKASKYLGFKAKKAVNFLFILVLLLGGASQAMYAWADAAYEARILLASELSPGFYGATAKRFLARHHIVNVSKRPASMNTRVEGKLHYPLQPLQVALITKKPNILIIAIDAWRYDSLIQGQTPNIYAFAESASRYQQHFSGGNSTRAGIFSLFYSVNPGDFDPFYRTGRGPVLFDVLYQQGYEVGIYPSASALSPPFHRTTFVNVRDFHSSTPGNDSVERDQTITANVRGFIQQAQHAHKPYFAFVFYDSVHAYNYEGPASLAPFRPAARVSHLNLHGKKQKQKYLNQYRNAVHFVDSLVGDVLKQVSKQDSANTLVIITSDHGEEFNDNGLGFWGHNGNFTPAQTHVPLVIHWPNQQKAETYQYITSHYDIVPTLLNKFLGVKNPLADYSIGFLLDDEHLREVILMGSYSKIALFLPAQALLAVTNRFGLFHFEDLRGRPLIKADFSGELFQQAFAQINHFHGVRIT